MYNRLSQLNPLWFLLAYAVAILLFGSVFSTLPPHSFYAPYARFEPNAYDDGLQVEADIVRALKRPQRHPYSEMGGEWTLDPQTIRVGEITNPSLNRLEFHVSFRATTGKIGEVSQHGESFTPFDVSIAGLPALVSGSTQEIHCVHPVELIGHNFLWNHNSFAELFRVPVGAIGATAIGPAVDFDLDGENHLNAFLVGLSGEPSQISGYLARMIYLSATTITTTGFGDIVPLSTMARILCGTEAVFGWLLAGLFLNAAAWRVTMGRMRG